MTEPSSQEIPPREHFYIENVKLFLVCKDRSGTVARLDTIYVQPFHVRRIAILGNAGKTGAE